MRYPGHHLGEQGQVPWKTDGPSLVPCKGHKATEKAEGTVISGEDAEGPGCILASSSLSRRDQRDSSQWGERKPREG